MTSQIVTAGFLICKSGAAIDPLNFLSKINTGIVIRVIIFES